MVMVPLGALVSGVIVSSWCDSSQPSTTGVGVPCESTSEKAAASDSRLMERSNWIHRVVDTDTEYWVLLGEYQGAVYFATELADPQGVGRLAHCESARFEDLRMLGGLLPEHDAGVLAYARAMLYWRHRHRFCGVCGSPNAPASAGHLMRCTNPIAAPITFLVSIRPSSCW